MKNYLLTAYLFAFILSSCSKDEITTEGELTDSEVKTDTTTAVTPNGNIYIAGSYGLGPSKKAVYFKNGNSIKLPNTGTSDRTNAISVSSKDVYVLGRIQNDLVYWKNNDAQLLLKGDIDDLRLSGKAIEIQGNDVHILASEIKNYFYPAILYWKNGVLNRITNSDEVLAISHDMLIDGDDVYIVGSEEPWEKVNFSGNDGINKVAKYWKNGEGNVLTDGSNNAEATVIVKENNDIYIGVEETKQRPNGTVYNKSYIFKNGIKVKTFSDNEVLKDFKVQNGVIHAIVRGFSTIKNGFESFLTYYKENEEKLIPDLDNSKILINGSDTYIIGSYYDESIPGPRSIIIKNDIITDLTVDGSFGEVEVVDIIFN